MKREELRKILFNKFSDNCKYVNCENVIDPNRKIHWDYICPLCCRGFSEDDLDQTKDNPLTVEDVPPKALKGKPITITCKECNSKAGILLDSELKGLIEHLNFQKPNTKANMEIDIKGVKLNAIMSFDENGKSSMVISKEFNNPQNWDKLALDLIDGEIKEESPNSITVKGDEKNEFSFKVKAKKTHRKKSLLSILRAGYLYAYTKFGAEFLALNPSLSIIRKQIDNPDEEIISNFGIMSFSLTEESVGVNWIPSMNCFLSVFKLELDTNVYYTGVVLPGPFQDSLKHFENLEEYRKQNEFLNGKKLPDVDYLKRENFGLLWNLINEYKT